MFLFCPLCSTNTFEPLEHIKVNVSPLATHGEALPSHHLLQRRSSEASTGGAAIIRTPKQQQGLADVKCRGEIKVIASASVAELNRYRANSQICPPCQRVTHLITSQYGRRPPPTRRRVHCQLISMTSSGGELAGPGLFLDYQAYPLPSCLQVTAELSVTINNKSRPGGGGKKKERKKRNLLPLQH